MHTRPPPAKRRDRAERWGAREWLGASLAATVLATVVGLFVDWHWLKLDGAPAWVQAIGSVLAILVAVAISTKQLREAQRADSMRAAQQLDAIAAMVDEFDRKTYHALIARHPVNDVQVPGVNHVYRIDEIIDEAQAAAEGIAAVRLDSIGSELAVQALLQIRSRLSGLVSLTQVMRSRGLTATEWNAFVAKRQGIDHSNQLLRHQAEWIEDGYPLVHTAGVRAKVKRH